MMGWQFALALCTSALHGWTPLVSMQNHYNLIYREEEREMLPLCRARGIAVIPWSPLARGFLAGNRTRDKDGETIRSKTDHFGHSLYYRDEDFRIVDRVVQVANGRGVQPTQVALAWLLQQPDVVSPVVGATKPHHLPEAVASLELRLTDDERLYIEELYQPHPVLAND
jgi:aryl-alcohol dehydrogenase (NADP+)